MKNRSWSEKREFKSNPRSSHWNSERREKPTGRRIGRKR
jgi:hypothetical protein